ADGHGSQGAGRILRGGNPGRGDRGGAARPPEARAAHRRKGGGGRPRRRSARDHRRGGGLDDRERARAHHRAGPQGARQGAAAQGHRRQRRPGAGGVRRRPARSPPADAGPLPGDRRVQRHRPADHRQQGGPPGPRCGPGDLRPLRARRLHGDVHGRQGGAGGGGDGRGAVRAAVGAHRALGRGQEQPAERGAAGAGTSRLGHQRGREQGAAHHGDGAADSPGVRRLGGRHAGASRAGAVGDRPRPAPLLLPRVREPAGRLPLSRLHAHARARLRGARRGGRRADPSRALRQLPPDVRRRAGRRRLGRL
ncbi:MAG: Ribosome small subunit biogenesis RbfA-release protein RsgA, partial [uncultured Gemmatimonadetes bacterium]